MGGAGESAFLLPPSLVITLETVESLPLGLPLTGPLAGSRRAGQSWAGTSQAQLNFLEPRKPFWQLADPFASGWGIGCFPSGPFHRVVHRPVCAFISSSHVLLGKPRPHFFSLNFKQSSILYLLDRWQRG